MLRLKRLFQKTSITPNKSGVILVIFRILGSLLQFPAIILLTRAWTSEQMGVWILVSSLCQVILTIADFGIGQSLRLAIAKSKQLAGSENGKQLTNSALSFLLVILFTILCSFFIAMLVFNPENLFLINNELLKSEISVLFIVYVCLNIVSVPSMVVIQLFFAFHESEKTAIFDFIRALSFFILAIFANSENFALIFVLVPLLTMVVRTVQVLTFYRIRKWSFSFIAFRKAFSIIKPHMIKSLEFWVLAALAIIQVALLPWLIAKIGSVSQLGEFSLLIQMLSFLLVLHLSFFIPLQSMYSSVSVGEAEVYFNKSLSISIAATPFILAIFLFSLPMLASIIGKPIKFEAETLAFFGVWGFLWVVINTTSIMLNGFGKIKIQIIGLATSILLPYLAFNLNLIQNIMNLFQFTLLGLLVVVLLNIFAAYKIFY